MYKHSGGATDLDFYCTEHNRHVICRLRAIWGPYLVAQIAAQLSYSA